MEPYQTEQSKMDHPGEESKSVWHSVTPFSKYLAMALFIIMPFVGGYIGYHYAPEKVVEQVVDVEPKQNVVDIVKDELACLSDYSRCEKLVYFSDEEQLAIADFDSSTSSQIILGVPEHTKLIDSLVTDEFILLVTLNEINFGYNESGGYAPPVTTVHFYDREKGYVDGLFESGDLEWSHIQIGDKNKSLDQRVWEFQVFGCIECGVHHPQKYLYDRKNWRNSHSIGQIIAFEWLNETDYRYKPLSAYSCDEYENPLCLFMEGEDHSYIPWSYGSME